jgi:hypothetical protein
MAKFSSPLVNKPVKHEKDPAFRWLRYADDQLLQQWQKPEFHDEFA